MGFAGISLTQLVVVLAIVLVIFGTKRVKSLGSDLGSAISGFRKALHADDDSTGEACYTAQPRLIEPGNDAERAKEPSTRSGPASIVD